MASTSPFVPYDYGTEVLTMSPAQVQTDANELVQLIDAVAQTLTTIDNILSGLYLGWAGATQQEAQDFSDQWTAAMTQLFGPASNPEAGIFNILANMLAAAAGNYDAAEDSIAGMFNSLTQNLISAQSGSGSVTASIPPGTSVTDPTMSAVSETNWSTIGVTGS